MTALELADWIENGAPFGKYETAKQAVIMLRQQQAEIEALKKQVGGLKLSLGNTELLLDESFDRTASHMAGEYVSYPANTISTPQPQTFTGENPFPAKTLTDEEIIEIWSGMENDTGEQNIAFARAILRKAQEK